MPPKPPPSIRKAKLAKALKANLARRKAAARARIKVKVRMPE
jgi:hypothetical protein